MEEKSPTMPCVVFLKYLKITATGADSQGKFDYAVCDEIQVRSVKTNATLESPKKVTQGAQTALARMGVWGKDGNESFPRWP